MQNSIIKVVNLQNPRKINKNTVKINFHNDIYILIKIKKNNNIINKFSYKIKHKL